MKRVIRQAEPYREGLELGDVYEILAGVVVLLSLFIGLPFLIWLIGSAGPR